MPNISGGSEATAAAMNDSAMTVLRKKERLVVHLTSLLAGEQIQGDGIVLNLSTTGCAMRSDRSLQIGDIVSLQVFFPENSVPIIIPKATVRWVNGGKFGLAFMDLSSDVQTRLRQLLDEHHLPVA